MMADAWKVGDKVRVRIDHPAYRARDVAVILRTQLHAEGRWMAEGLRPCSPYYVIHERQIVRRWGEWP